MCLGNPVQGDSWGVHLQVQNGDSTGGFPTLQMCALGWGHAAWNVHPRAPISVQMSTAIKQQIRLVGMSCGPFWALVMQQGARIPVHLHFVLHKMVYGRRRATSVCNLNHKVYLTVALYRFFPDLQPVQFHWCFMHLLSWSFVFHITLNKAMCEYCVDFFS